MTDQLRFEPPEWEEPDSERFPSPPSIVPSEGAQEALPAVISCWRCSKNVESSHDSCPFCLAPLRKNEGKLVERHARSPRPADSATHPIIKVVCVFALFLVVSVILGWVLHFGFENKGAGKRDIEQQFHVMLVAEGVDTVLVAGALIWVGRLPRLRQRSFSLRVMTWIYAAPVLLLALGINFGYHRLLRDYLSLPDEGTDPIIWAHGLSALVWLSYCIQPAVVEELLCRYLAIGALRDLVSDHAAVLISAVMFGVAHIYNPLAIPYLILMGVILGYARLLSGTILLPMLLHFGHNAAIVLVETLL
jgi:membrane protease YdiL (CAAX protease family)